MDGFVGIDGWMDGWRIVIVCVMTISIASSIATSGIKWIDG